MTENSENKCSTEDCENNTYKRKFCSTCRGKKDKKENPLKYWAQRWIREVRRDSSRKSIDPDIDYKYLIKKYKQAKKKFKKLCIDPNSPYHLSVDRIDNNKGYTKGNIQIVPIFINCGKMHMSMDEFEEAIKEYYENCIK